MEEDKSIKILMEYEELDFCLLVILYYLRNINKIIEPDEIISKFSPNLFSDLPSEIIKFLQQYDFENKIKIIDKDKLESLINKKYDYLIHNVKSIFSLWKILFRHFAGLSSVDHELFEEVFSALNITSLGELKNLMYVGEGFNPKEGLIPRSLLRNKLMTNEVSLGLIPRSLLRGVSL